MIFKNKKELINSVLDGHEKVLDVGFWGQGVEHGSDNWVHKLIKDKGVDLYGIDLQFDRSVFGDENRYFFSNAEDFDFKNTFDVIFAGDLIEHLSNPGLFLESCQKSLKSGGVLILTTPNTFNLFNIAGKITNSDPVVNYDHTMYLNPKTITRLLDKNNFEVANIHYLYTLGFIHKESIKKKVLNVFYKILSIFTPKFSETMVVIAKIKS